MLTNTLSLELQSIWYFSQHIQKVLSKGDWFIITQDMEKEDMVLRMDY